jgi:hypothetical protein
MSGWQMPHRKTRQKQDPGAVRLDEVYIPDALMERLAGQKRTYFKTIQDKGQIR